ncbi:amidase [Reichenbachiella ulvae]|uniref:Amidase n=1 Tax=Reichenbachiella ulvae TaxID=2980104 RepID=A0ABT3CXN5_9BACT|nr:amidase [Reichenbachiella ulvae]MCV9388313.1 amidase [Reichenbachiella ulvae]
MKNNIYYLSLFLLLLACEPKESTSPVEAAFSLSPEVTIADLKQGYADSSFSISEVTQFYLDRIQAIDQSGPKLNAVLTVNPDAMKIAEQLDLEMRNGQIRGPLHGIPILLKDNIDTRDKMPCTAGSVIMKESYPDADSPLAAQLRIAGAIILGKANLSEWANFHSSYSSSGWSALGGQTKNPYDLSRNPCGSSAGSGAAVSANLCVIAIGTETNGSIVCPSNANGVVGIKPTVGLISRTGIIPISFTQDTGGPMARNMTDAVIALGTLTSEDENDSKTLNPDRVALKDYTPYLKKDGLKGKKIGFYKEALKGHKILTSIMEQAIDDMEAQGAEVVEIENLLPSEAEGDSYQVLLYEFKAGLNEYFENLGEDAPVKSLSELVEKTLADSVEMKYFDHQILIDAEKKGGLDEDEYQTALTSMLKASREEGIDKVMNELDLDAIIGPTGSPAWQTDELNGDNYSIYSSSPAAIAGYPSISVPMGNVDGMPVGISFFGQAWTEAKLIEIAYAYEQSTQHRLTPEFKD